MMMHLVMMRMTVVKKMSEHVRTDIPWKLIEWSAEGLSATYVVIRNLSVHCCLDAELATTIHAHRSGANV